MLLGKVHALIGALQQLTGFLAGLPLRHAKTGRDAQGLAAFQRHLHLGLDRLTQALGQHQRLAQNRLWQHHDELLAAVTRHPVHAVAQHGLHLGHQLHQDLVTDGVAMPVIDRFEAVHVAKDHAQRMVVTVGTADFRGEALVKASSVEAGGQGIHGRQGLERVQRNFQLLRALAHRVVQRFNVTMDAGLQRFNRVQHQIDFIVAGAVLALDRQRCAEVVDLQAGHKAGQRPHRRLQVTPQHDHHGANQQQGQHQTLRHRHADAVQHVAVQHRTVGHQGQTAQRAD